MERTNTMERTTTKAARRPRRASLVAALVAVALSVATIAYAASLILTPDYGWYTEDPTASTYEISSAPQMLGLAYLTNGLADLDGDGQAEEAVDFSGKTVNQTADITFRNASGYIPVGTPNHPFNGTFDGQGHQITNLTIDCGSESVPASRAVDGTTVPATSTTCYVGLFGYCGADSTLENVTIGNTVAISVTDPDTAATGATGALDEVVTADTVIHDVGSLVGYTEGSVSGITSYATVTATNNLAATDDDPEVILNVGGIAGTIEGNLASCAVAGNITVEAPTLAPDTQDCVVANVGGLVGTLGAATDDGRSSISGTITNCTYGYSDDSGYFGIGTTQVTLHVVTTGVGGLDRFGVEKEATSISVGGIAGYSYGSIANCTNYALVNTNSTDARLYKNSQSLVRIVDAADPTPTTYPSTEDLFTIANGGSGVGGVVGTLRASGMSAAGIERTDVGSADSAISLTQSFNAGMVVGLAHTGGIAGSVGSYAAIDSCRNGKVSSAGAGTADDCGHVVTTRWNKPMTGGIVGATYSNISNCCNLSEVENIQTGYYTAGIVGSLRSPDTYTAECYACFNSGQVHVASYATQSYREAGLVGNNAGYLHDSVMRSGCVLAHDDEGATYPNAAIGDDSWGMWSNVKFFSASELRTSSSAAVLNAAHAQDVLTLPEQEWTYWYVSGAGYPVLNVWDEPTDRTSLTSANVSATCVTFAEYAGTAEAIPDLVVTYTSADGTQSVLTQNVDYYVIPQKGATSMTSLDADTTPYKASIIGIGNYEGTVQDVCKYGIGPCDLSNCSVSTSSETYNFETPVYPDEVYVTNPAGAQLDAFEFRYEIYDGDTYALTSGNQKRGVLYDSEGYVSWDGGATRQSVSSAHERFAGDLTGVDYILYNADGEAIFKVEGGTPGQANGTSYEIDPLTGAETENLGLSYYKAAREGVTGGGLAGYIVKVSAKSESKNLKSDSWTTGQYVVNPIDLYQEAKIEQVQVTLPTADGSSIYTETWYWDKASSTLYELDDQGNPVRNSDGSLKQAAVTFTGGEIDPTTLITYTKENGETVTIPQDASLGYTLVYGDPYTKKVDLAYTNRDATPVDDPGEEGTEEERALYDQLDDHEKAAVTVRATTTYRFSNYVHMYFAIDPVDVGECEIAMPGTPDDSGLCTYAYRGGYGVRPTVGVTRCGNTLVAGTDYEVTYDNNVEPTTQEAIDAYLATGDTSGLASCTVTGLGNVTGSRTYYFMIASGKSLSEEGITIQAIADQQWNLGRPVQPAEGVVLLDKDGNPVDLVEGTDFELTFADNTDVGSPAKVYVRGINGYTGILTASFSIVPFDMNDSANAWRISPWYNGWTDPWDGSALPAAYPWSTLHRFVYAIVDWNAYYSGDFDAAAASVVDSTVGLNLKFTAKADGKTYSYSDTDKYQTAKPPAGAYTLDVEFVDLVSYHNTGKSSIVGTDTLDVEIAKTDLADLASVFYADDQTYTGQPLTPEVKSMPNTQGDFVVEIDECTVSYEENIEAGTAIYRVTPDSNADRFCGSYVGTFTIAKQDLADAEVLVRDQLYTGSNIEPEVRVVVDGVELVRGRDYTVDYANNKAKGTATVVVAGIGSCEGETKVNFKIGGRLDISQADIAAIDDQLYTGSAVEPRPTVTYEGTLLVEGVDYTLTYENNTEVSTEKSPAKVTVTGKGTFVGSSSQTSFNIVKTRDIAKARCSVADQTYTGAAITPALEVEYDGRILQEGTDYTVEYRRNIKAGASARAVVTGIGSYEGELIVPFNIVVRDGEVERIGESATSASQLAVQVADAVFPFGCSSAIVAGEGDWAAQAASYTLSSRTGAPVVLTGASGLSAEVRAWLAESGAGKITVVSTYDGAIADEVLDTLRDGMGIEVTDLRTDGASTLSLTLSALQQQASPEGERGTVAVVVCSTSADGAACASAAACMLGAPLYFTDADGTLPASALSEIASYDKVLLAGDATQVDASVEAALAGTVAVRFDAGDACELSAMLAEYLYNRGVSADGTVIASVLGISREMSAIGLAAARGVPLLIVTPWDVSAIDSAAGARYPAYSVTAVGTELLFPESLVAEVAARLGWER
jgi:hypothetical protein